ncbi:MAG: response regulator transcription factor [Bacteroidota bacterium]
MAKHILIVDDEAHMRMGLKDNLEFEGYEVSEAVDGIEGLEKANEVNPDLIVLDVMMPNLSGFEVCKQLRKSGNETPIILLTAKGEEIDKVLGLEIGADDYVQKPFSLRELIARIKAILRRSVNHSEVSEEVAIGLLKVNFKEYRASRNGQEEKLSHKEFEILHYLLEHKNEIVDRHDLLKNVWGYNEQPTTRTVDNFIVKLRQKTEEDPHHPKHIITIHGVGYKLLA